MQQRGRDSSSAGEKPSAQRLSAIVSDRMNLKLVEPHIYSVYSETEHVNPYDKMGGIYDLVACNPIYNRLVWGYRISEYHRVCLDALTSSAEGWVLDVGCGSLAFTAKTYVGYSARPVVLLDQSIRLLRMAKAKLVKLCGTVPDHMVFVHGDALQLPFKPYSFGTIISLNLLHVLDDVGKAVREFRRVLSDRGTITCTTLVRNNRLADRYLDQLGRIGAVVPRDVRTLSRIFDEVSIAVRIEVKGSLAFVSSGQQLCQDA
ncbi:MAG: class I SAM-dependent methyltransferase [Thermodesulfobacteriota bacterium]